MNMEKQLNYYEVLDLIPHCRMEDIEKAYRIAKNTYRAQSPALYSLYENDDNTDTLRLVEEAYSVLSAPGKRKEYDRVKGFLSQNLVNPSISLGEGKAREIANEQSKYTSTLKVSNVEVSAYSASKKYALDYDIDPRFETEIEETVEFTGEFLKQIREYKKVSIERMVELTCISKTKLKYIESENFSELPAKIYVRGYVYQYAKCLKLDTEKVITSYLKRLPNE